jgi:Bifunctional DNA primase/polymerase, N-terminal
MTTALGAAAIHLAEQGYAVFPLVPAGKVPLTRNGVCDATIDSELIAWWWRRCPTSNIGLSCGSSGVTVLDIDTKAGADPCRVLAGRDLRGFGIVGTGVAPTPSAEYPRSLEGRRGVHLYMRGAGKTRTRLALDGCELRGVGSYVVARPSVHPSGASYLGELPRARDLAPVPSWLAELAGG